MDAEVSLSHESISSILTHIEQEIINSKDTHKLRASINLLIGLLPAPSALTILVHHLINSSIPAIRHLSSSSLWTKYVEEDGKEEIADLLASVDWVNADEIQLKAEIGKLCELLSCSIPAEKSKENQRIQSKTRAEMPAYQELVKEEHW